jgi:hypothetical protein
MKQVAGSMETTPGIIKFISAFMKHQLIKDLTFSETKQQIRIKTNNNLA